MIDELLRFLGIQIGLLLGGLIGVLSFLFLLGWSIHRVARWIHLRKYPEIADMSHRGTA